MLEKLNYKSDAIQDGVTQTPNSMENLFAFHGYDEKCNQSTLVAFRSWCEYAFGHYLYDLDKKRQETWRKELDRIDYLFG